MDHLVHVEEKEIIIDFELGRKCKTALHIRNLMHTMPVAFKLQTTSPHKFCVQPPNGYIPPLSELSLIIILKPQQELPSFPISPEKFVLKTALAHHSHENSTLPERVPNKWFSSPQTRVFIDAKLKVVYIGASLLWHSVLREDEHAVREMLVRHAGPSNADEDGKTALHIAASIGNLKLVEMLLQCGAQMNAMDVNGRTPLWEAVCRGHVNVVKELLKSGASLELNEALKRGSVAPIHTAATLTGTEMLQQLIKGGASLEETDQEGRTALHFAIESERLENLKVLLHAGADKNAQRGDGRTPLLIAAENGLLEAVHLLLKDGAHARRKCREGQAVSTMASEMGHMIVIEALKAGEELLQAARQGDAEAVATLLQHKAGKKGWIKDSSGWTALHVAAFKGHLQIVQRLLLEEGGRAVLQEGDAEGHTPLHCGAEGGSVEVVELLLATGADPLAISSRGATPADLADALGFKTIAKLIRQQASIRPGNCHYYNHEFEVLHPLHRRSISSSPNLISSSTNSESHKEKLVASSVRFSTPTKLHQSCRSDQRLSSPINANGRTPEDKISNSSRSRQRLPHRASISSQDVKVMQTPASTKLADAEHATESKPASLPPIPLIAPAMPIAEVSSTPHIHHATDSRILSHTSSIKSLSQAVQNPQAVQPHNKQPRKEKEKNYKGNPIQHNMRNSNSNLQSSHQRSPKLTLATLFEKVHGSKMERSSSPTITPTAEDDLISSNQVKNHNLSHEIHHPKASLLSQKNKSIPFETYPHNSKLSPPLSPVQEPAEQSSQKSSTTKPLSLHLYTTWKDEGLDKSSLTMQLHSTTEDSKADDDGPALENSVSEVQLQYTHEFIKSLAFVPPTCEAQPQCIYKGIEDLSLCKQNSMAFTSSARKIAHTDEVENLSVNSPSSKQLEDAKPQVLLVETSPITMGEAHNTPTSMQLQTLTVNPSVDIKTMPLDDFAGTTLSTYEGINTLDADNQCIPSASPSCKKADFTTFKDKRVTSIVGQAHGYLETSTRFPTRESSPSISDSSSARELCIQSEHDLRIASPPKNGTEIFEVISSVCKTEQSCKTALKPTVKASSSDQTGPTYTPPLTIKQMRKPLSTSIPKTTDFLQEIHMTKPRRLQQQV